MVNNVKYKELPSTEKLLNTLRQSINTAWNINTIHENAIQQWLDNFDGSALQGVCADVDKRKEKERQIALFLLCNFVYYNETEIKHLMKLMLDKYIHKYFENSNKICANDDEIEKLIKNTAFISLGNQSESSAYILYLFRQINELSKYNFNIKENTERLVFVDDFSITGSQVENYIKEYFKNSSNQKFRDVYVLLAISTQSAVERIKKLPQIKDVIACVVMDESSKAFSDISIIFQGYPPELKRHAETICTYYGDRIINDSDKKSGVGALGFKNCGYLLGTYYNTPNNTLPIFWSEENSWKPIFKRYNKKYIYMIKERLGGQYV